MQRFSGGLVPLPGRGAIRSTLHQPSLYSSRSSAARRQLSHVHITPSSPSKTSLITTSSHSASPHLVQQSASRPLFLQSSPFSQQRLYSQFFRQSSGNPQTPNSKPVDGDATAQPDGAAKPAPDAKTSDEEVKTEGEKETKEGDQEGKSEKKEEGEGEGKKDKKEPPPPPPPHGDKTPWQVFTETLQSEFKASKEWNDSTKALQSGMDDFTQNPNVQRAKSAYTQSRDAASTATSQVFKTTGKAIGQGAAWTWETPVVKGVRAGVNAAGSGIEKATRPIRETEAFKSVKNTLDDGSSSRYGGWAEKEERRKRRELRELNELKRTGGKRAEKMEEDPDAGTNVTLHKDAAWKEQWRDFRDQSKVMQGFFNMKSAYNESENPFVSTARGIFDRIGGFFAENETAQVIKKFREIDPNFKMEPFLTEMREYILPEVLDAYVKGDVETLKLWLSAAQYQVYAALMQQYTTAGLKSDGRILDIRHVDVLTAKLLDPGDIPVFIITCRTQEVHVYKNAKTGDLAAGMDDRVQQVTYVIGVTRLPEDVNNPETRGWRMIELHKSARDYI